MGTIGPTRTRNGDISFPLPVEGAGMQVLVHGGAGGEPDDPDGRESALAGAVESGVAATTPQAAAVAAVRHLEADPRFNAGTGSAVQSDGLVRTEAGLMTDDGESGAACGLVGVEHAVDVARVVKAETPHVLLAGEPAVGLADAFGVPTDRDLWTDRTRERWAAEDPPVDPDAGEQLAWLRTRFGASDGTDNGGRDHDTVGAVATDGTHLAAATSTGGRWFALAGRVGDVPQVGAGFFASPEGAASATGEGEAIARFGLARRVVEAIEDGDDPQRAADRVLRGFASETGAEAGVIAVDAAGATGRATNAERMQTAAEGD
jgi:isoaspartyl peptidase/L-asparaginase-like protein (Ntn-hydrolase superfamily)